MRSPGRLLSRTALVTALVAAVAALSPVSALLAVTAVTAVTAFDDETPATPPTTVQLALAAVRADPTDAQALGNLAEALKAEDRIDEALHWILRRGALTGDEQLVESWVTNLDPLLEARHDALAAAQERLLDRARAHDTKGRPLNMLADLDTSRLLLRGLPQLAGSADGLRDELVNASRRTRERLAAAQVPLGLSDGLDLPAPDAAPGRATTLRSRHHAVSTTLGRPFADAVIEMLGDLQPHLQEGFADKRRRDPLAFEILTRAAEFESQRPGGEGRSVASRHELAFTLADERRVVVLDPRQIGEPFDVIWGLLAREAARDFVHAMEWVPPPWLQEALCLSFEGLRRDRFGGLDLGAPPWHRMEDVLLSLRGRGSWRPELDDLLALDELGGPRSSWAWAFLEYLREARDDEGEPLWLDRLEQLLADYRQDSRFSIEDERFDVEDPKPVDHFKLRMLPPGVAADEARAGVSNLHDLERLFDAWLRHIAAVDGNKTAALTAEVLAVREALALGDPDALARRLQRVLAVRPEFIAAWKLLADVEKRRRDTDAAILAARRVDALTPHAGDDADAKPFAAVARFDASLAKQIADDEALLRADINGLVDRYLALDHPRSAVRLLGDALAALPFDGAFTDRRDDIVQRFALDDLILRHTVDLERASREAHGDRSLWLVSGEGLTVKARDRIAPAALRGLVHLRAPYRLELRLVVLQSAETDSGNDFAGLTFGGVEAHDPGDWALFATPAGRVRLATPGRLEWPSTDLSRLRTGTFDLVLTVDDEHFSLQVGEVDFGRHALGARQADGWLGLYVRHTDAHIRQLVVTHLDEGSGPVAWYARGRP